MAFGLSLEEAARLHGHKGPWLVIGYRAGLRAREVLEPHTEHDLLCVARLPTKIPYTCSLDGIQAASGCTLGKQNIVVEGSANIEFEFVNRRTGRKLILKLRDGVKEFVDRELESKSLEDVARCIEEMDFRELFEERVE